MNKPRQDKVVVSFIIPAYNEENCIGENLQAIRENSPNYHYQIIVVDNGSTDNTSEIVQVGQAILIKCPKGTIASARNKGVQFSEGQVLIFLDADVLVTSTWQKEIDKTVDNILKYPLLITGSRCGVMYEKNWFSRYWFSRMQYEKANYINTGHLITSRELYDFIGGFREELHTAEDYDFCIRAKQAGADIINNPKLYVIHTGYPDTLKGFLARERWHGVEDFTNLHKILKSKEALVAIMNIVLLIGCLVIAVLRGNVLYVLLYFILMYILSGISTVIKFGLGSTALLLNTSTIFYFYYLGRSLALIEKIKSLLNFKDISTKFTV